MALSAYTAHADLNNFLTNLNNKAIADIDNFNAGLSFQFGVSLPQINAILETVKSPADAFMCLQLGQMTNRQPKQVLQIYKSYKSKGWGAIAKELGIKPGSADFHNLKQGNFTFANGFNGQKEKKNKGYGRSMGKKGKSKGKSKGHNE